MAITKDTLGKQIVQSSSVPKGTATFDASKIKIDPNVLAKNLFTKEQLNQPDPFGGKGKSFGAPTIGFNKISLYNPALDNDYNVADRFEVTTYDQNTNALFTKAADAAKAVSTRPAGMPDSEYEKYAAQKLKEQKDVGTQGQNMDQYRIVEGTDLPHLDKATNFMIVGRDRLDGIDPTDKVVVYDRDYGKFYRYTEDDKAKELQDKVTKSAEHIQTVSTYATSYMKSYSNIVEGYQKEIKKALDEKNTSAVDDLTKKYQSAVDRYNKAAEEMKNMIGPAYDNYVSDSSAYTAYGKVSINEDTKAKMKAYADAYSDTAHKIKKSTATIGAQQDISASDAMLALLHYTLTPLYYSMDKTKGQTLKEYYAQEAEKGLYGYAGNPLETAKEVIRMHIAPIQLMMDGTIDPLTAAGLTANNMLLGLSEDMDFFSLTPATLTKTTIKAIREGDMQPFYNMYHTPGAAELKNGRYVSANYDWDTGNIGKNILLELVSDPSNFVRLAAIPAMNISSKKALTKAFSEIAPEASEKAMKDAVKSALGLNLRNLGKGTLDLQDSVYKGAAKLLTKEAYESGQQLIADSAYTFSKAVQTSKAFTIASTFSTIGAANDFMQSTVATANLLGANKALMAIASPLAKQLAYTMKNFAPDFAPKFASAVKTFESRVKGIFTNEVPQATKMVDEYAAIKEEYLGILDILGHTPDKHIQDSIKDIYSNAVVRTELSELLFNLKKVNAGDMKLSELDGFAIQKTNGRFKQFLNLQDMENSYYGQLAKQLTAPEFDDKLNTVMHNIQTLVNRATFNEYAGFADVQKYKGWLKEFSDANKVSRALLRNADTVNGEVAFHQSLNKLNEFKQNLLSLPKVDKSDKLRKAIDNFMSLNMREYMKHVVIGENVEGFLKNKEIENSFRRMKYHLKNYEAEAFKFNQYRDWVKGDYVAKAIIPPTRTDLAMQNAITGADVFNAVYQELKKDAPGLTAEMLKESVFKSEITGKESGHYVKFMMSNAAETLEYTSNKELAEATAELIDLNDNVIAVPMINKGINNMYAYKNQTNLLNNFYAIPDEVVPAELKMGLVDALTVGHAEKYADLLGGKQALLRQDMMDDVAEKVTNHVVDTALRYYNGTHDASLRFIQDGSKLITVNAVDTTKNMEVFLDMLDNGMLKDAKVDINSVENTTDVYYTLSRTNYKADPYAITFHTADGGTKTFINKDVDFYTDAGRASAFHGVSVGKVHGDYETFVKSNPGSCYSNDSYLDEVRKYLEDVMATNNKADDKHIRLIGFNSSRAGTGQQDALSNFLYRNAMRTYVGEFIDAADYVRDMKGIKYFSDEGHQAIKNAITDVLHDINFDNIRNANVVGNLVPVFDDANYKALEFYVRSIKKELIKIRYDGVEREAMYKTMDKYLAALRTVRESNSIKNVVLSDYAVDVDELNSLMKTLRTSKRNVNLSNVLYESLAKEGTIPVNIKDIVNDKLVSEYFDVDTIYKTIDFYNQAAVHANKMSMEDVLDIIRKINRKIDVANMPLLHTYDREKLVEFSKFLIDEFEVSPILANFDYSQMDMPHLYAAVSYTAKTTYEENIMKFSSYFEKLSERIIKHEASDFDIFLHEMKGLIDNEDKLLYNIGTLFTTETKTFASKFADRSSDIFAWDSLSEDLTRITRSINNVSSRLSLQDVMKDKEGFATANKKIMASSISNLTKPMRNFIDAYEIGFSAAKAEYYEALASGGKKEYIEAKMAYSAQVNSMISDLENIKELHALAATKAKLSVDSEDIVSFVLRDCYNNVVINTHSNVFTKHKDLLTPLNEFLERATANGLTVEHGEQYIRVYKDMSGIDPVEIGKMLEVPRFNQFNQKDFLADLIRYPKYAKALEKISINMPPSYIYSDFLTMTDKAYAEMAKDMPANAVIEEGILKRVKLFDTGFNMGFIGDYATDARQYNDYMSTNLLSNMLSGFHMAANNLEYVRTHTNFFMNPMNAAGRYLSNMEWHEAQNVIRNNDYVLASLEKLPNGKLTVKQHFIYNEKEYNRIINNSSVSLMDRMVLKEMEKSVIMQNLGDQVKNTNNLIKTGYKTIMYMYKLGWLFISPGAAMRNVVDATLKGAAITENLPGFIDKAVKAPFIIRNYQKISNEIIDSLNMPSALTEDIIREYFAKNKVPGMDFDRFMSMFILQNDDVLKIGIANPIKKNKIFLQRQIPTDPNAKAITEDVWKSYKRAFKGTAAEENIIRYHMNVLEELKKLDLSEEHYRLFSSLDHLYLPNTARIKELITGESNYLINANQAMFQVAENNARTAVALTMLEDNGSTMAEALRAIDVSQFDYDTVPKALSLLEKIAPFQTFKLYNMMFWLNRATQSATMMRPVMSLLRGGDYFIDEDEADTLAYNAMWQAKIANGDVDFTDEDNIGLPFLQQVMNNQENSIDNYKGMSPYSIKGNGSIALDNGHVLKIGNSLIDAVTYCISLATLPQQLMSGNYTTLLQDNLFAPIVTMATALKAIWEADGMTDDQKAELYASYITSNQYRIVDLIPLYGAIVNQLTAGNRNSKLSEFTLSALIPDGRRSYREYISDIQDGIASLFPGILSIARDVQDKPIGYDWYNQSDEYKQSHRYVVGVSYVPAWVKKDPSKYVDSYAQLRKLGYTNDEAHALMEEGWYITNDEKIRNAKDYDVLPNQLVFNRDVYDNTLEYLITSGYTPDEAMEYMAQGAVWVDNRGNKYNDINSLEDIESSKFLQYWQLLPEYIQYESGQYSKLYQYYKDKGYKGDIIKAAILSGAGYIDSNGNYLVLDDEVMAAKAQQINDDFLEAYSDLPDFIKYADGAFSRTKEYLNKSKHLDSSAALTYMVEHNAVVDEDGVYHEYNDTEITGKNKESSDEFLAMYNNLPASIKYEKGAYSRTLKHLKDLGFSKDEAIGYMMQGYYFSEDGQSENVLNKPYTRQKAHYNKTWIDYAKRNQFKKLNRMAKPTSYNSSRQTARRFAAVKKRSNRPIRVTSASTDYVVDIKKNATRVALNLKSAYPSSYRNIRFGYRKNMYKDLYAKYGMSRMKMRANKKSYSNMSITKLRRKDVQWKMQMQTKREQLAKDQRTGDRETKQA